MAGLAGRQYLEALPDAGRIADIIRSEKRVPAIEALMAAGSNLGFDLCASLGADCREQLYQNVLGKKNPSEFIEFLAINQIVLPSPALAMFARQHRDLITSDELSQRVLYALSTGDIGQFFEIVFLEKDNYPGVIEAISARIHDIPDAMKRDFLALALKRVTDDKSGYHRTAIKIIFQLESFDVDVYKLLEDQLKKPRVGSAFEFDSEDLAVVGGAQLLADLSGMPIKYEQETVEPTKSTANLRLLAPVVIEEMPDALSHVSMGAQTISPSEVKLDDAPGRKLTLQRIIANGNVDALFKFVLTHGVTATLPIELLAESDDYIRVQTTLIPLCSDPDKQNSAVRALAQVQFNHPDERLVDCYIIHGSSLSRGVSLEVMTAIWARRIGNWSLALVKGLQYFGEGNSYPPLFVYQARNELSPAAIDSLQKWKSSQTKSALNELSQDDESKLLWSWLQKVGKKEKGR